MAHSTLAVLPSPEFPQVPADRAALDTAREELGISDGDRLSTPQVRAYLQRALQIKADRQLAAEETDQERATRLERQRQHDAEFIARRMPRWAVKP